MSKNSSQKSSPFEEVLNIIRQGKSFLVTTHGHPDGDALGSAIALGLGIRSLNKKAKIYNPDPVPGNLKFLPHSSDVEQILETEEKFDASFIVDCAEPERVGKVFVEHKGCGALVVIDHHRKSGRAGDINLIDPVAPSTGTMVLKVLQELKVTITKTIATNIYTTLVTDTGNFRYSNTDASVLALATDLVRKGVVPWEITKNIFDSYPVERISLLGCVLNSLEVSSDGLFASIVMTQKDLESRKASSDLADEFINYPRSIDTVEVAFFFRELPDGRWKVSFRSKERVDVAALASQFNGGGHARAAGCTLEGSLREVRERVHSAVQKVLK